MAFSYSEYTGDGNTRSFTFSFEGQDEGYINTNDIVALVDGSSEPFTLLSSNTLEFNVAPPEGARIFIRRIMPKDTTYADFRRGNNFGQELINDSFLQSLYVIHEVLDGWFPDNFRFFTKVSFSDDVEFEGFDINNAGTLTAQDIVIGPLGLSAEGILTEAYNWAQYPTDQLVPEGNGVDEYSALHHRDKAEDAQALSEFYRDSSQDYSVVSQNWAEFPVDSEVPDNAGSYSSLHHRTKSEDAQVISEQARDSSIAARNASQAAQEASELARDESVSARDTTLDYRDTTLGYRDNAEEWAANPEDVEVEAGLFSSLHYAAKASDSQTAAANSESEAADSAIFADNRATDAANEADTATIAANNSEDSAVESSNWAKYPEDQPVPEGNGVDDYSSLHWAKKAEGFANSLNIPNSRGQGGNYLRQKLDGSGLEYVPLLTQGNLVDDGRFYLWNESTSHTLLDGNFGSSDLWLIKGHLGNRFELSRYTFPGDTSLPSKPINAAKAETKASVSSFGYASLSTKLEDVRRFSGRTLTISYLAAGLSGVSESSFEMEMNFGNGNSINEIGVNKVSLTSNWNLFSHTFTLPEIPSGETLGDLEDTFIELNFWVSAGSNFNDRTDFLGSQIGSLFLTDVRLEYGTQPHRDYWESLSEVTERAKRYFVKGDDKGNTDKFLFTATQSYSGFNIDFKREMRAVPSLSLGNPQSADDVYDGGIRGYSAGTVGSLNRFNIQFSDAFEAAIGRSGISVDKRGTDGTFVGFEARWKADARL